MNLCSALQRIPNILQSKMVLYGISLLMDPSEGPCNGSRGYLRCSLSPLQSLRAAGIRIGWARGCELMAVSRVVTPARGPVEFLFKVQQENKLSSCTPELCCQFGKH